MSDRPEVTIPELPQAVASSASQSRMLSGRRAAAAAVPPPRQDRLAAPMFWIAAVQLLFFAGMIHRLPYNPFFIEKVIILGGTFTLWAVIVAEAVYRLVVLAEGKRRKEFMRLGLILIFPPARMGAPSLIRQNQIYLPGFRWKDLDERLEQKVARKLGVPMIGFALLILPLLALEFLDFKLARSWPWLGVMLEVGTAVIWIAFAVDFVLGMAVATKPMRYFTTHLLDFMIVVIPMFQFILTQIADAALLGRLLRLSRLSQILSRSALLYQMRTLPLKAWKALVALEAAERLIHHAMLRILGVDPLVRERAKLQKQLEDLERQRIRLFEERVDLDKRIAAKKLARSKPPAQESE